MMEDPRAIGRGVVGGENEDDFTFPHGEWLAKPPAASVLAPIRATAKGTSA